MTLGGEARPPDRAIAAIGTTTDAITRSRVLYFYAENQGVGRVWDGIGREESIPQTVSDSRFDHVVGERLPCEGPRNVSFFRRLSGKEWMDYTEGLRMPHRGHSPAGLRRREPLEGAGPGRGTPPQLR